MLAGLVLALGSGVSLAEPWAAPGDTRLRHDLQMLYDRGLLTGPSLSWPVSWPDIDRDLRGIDANQLELGLAAAVQRVRKQLREEQNTYDVDVEFGLAGAADPAQIRTFAYTPREEGEAVVAAKWLGERFAWKLSGTVVSDPDDDQEFRPDGSYVGMSLGNWMLSFGWLDRWWGPGWDGNLLLTSNARPTPAISIERAQATASDLPILRWIGPWRFVTFMGQLEEDREYPDALLFGMRIEMRPVPSLQIAASRSAQWCGEDRPCDLSTFWDLIVGNDNDQPVDEQPGNQLAGFDVRWTWPGGRVPLALYAQGIGEDEAGFLPSKYLGLFGAEVWGGLGGGSWRAHVEYADTACDFLSDPPEFGCAYTNVIYTDGYRYRGRAIGHTIDADGESVSVGGMFIDAAGNEWRATVRDMKLNRAGVAPLHSLADVPTNVKDVDLVHERSYDWGTIELSLGYADVDGPENETLQDGARGFLTWKYTWR